MSFNLQLTGNHLANVAWTWFDQIDHIEKIGDREWFFTDLSGLGQFADFGGPWLGRGVTIQFTDRPATYGVAPEPATFLLTLPVFGVLWLWRKRA